MIKKLAVSAFSALFMLSSLSAQAAVCSQDKALQVRDGASGTLVFEICNRRPGVDFFMSCRPFTEINGYGLRHVSDKLRHVTQGEVMAGVKGAAAGAGVGLAAAYVAASLVAAPNATMYVAGSAAVGGAMAYYFSDAREAKGSLRFLLDHRAADHCEKDVDMMEFAKHMANVKSALNAVEISKMAIFSPLKNSDRRDHPALSVNEESTSVPESNTVAVQAGRAF